MTSDLLPSAAGALDGAGACDGAIAYVLLCAMWSPGRKQIAVSCGGLQILRWREQAFSEDAPATLAPEPESTATDYVSALLDRFVSSGNHGRQGSGCIGHDS